MGFRFFLEVANDVTNFFKSIKKKKGILGNYGNCPSLLTKVFVDALDVTCDDMQTERTGIEPATPDYLALGQRQQLNFKLKLLISTNSF